MTHDPHAPHLLWTKMARWTACTHNGSLPWWQDDMSDFWDNEGVSKWQVHEGQNQTTQCWWCADYNQDNAEILKLDFPGDQPTNWPSGNALETVNNWCALAHMSDSSLLSSMLQFLSSIAMTGRMSEWKDWEGRPCLLMSLLWLEIENLLHWSKLKKKHLLIFLDAQLFLATNVFDSKECSCVGHLESNNGF